MQELYFAVVTQSLYTVQRERGGERERERKREREREKKEKV